MLRACGGGVYWCGEKRDARRKGSGQQISDVSARCFISRRC